MLAWQSTGALLLGSALAVSAALSMGACSKNDAGVGAAPGSGASGGQGGSSGSGPGPEPLVCDAAPYAGEAPGRLLTRVQYDNVVADLLGDETRPAQSFPAENTVLGFENNADLHQATPRLVDKYIEASEAIARAAVEERLDELLPCDPAGQSADCAYELIDALGPRAFRRPLTDAERALFVGLFDDSRAEQGYADAIGMVIEAMLQSPQFLYRLEAVGEAPTEETGAVAVSSWEMASRLSFFLTNSMPDDELFAAAENDELRTEEEIEAQARRLLKSERAVAMTADFHRQWLGLDRFSGVVREGTGFEDAAALSDDWRASIDEFMRHVFWDEGTVSALFTSNKVFLNADLAALYGLAPPASGLQAFELPADERAGLLTQPALLALFAHPEQSAPIQRGVFVREQIMCQPLEPPPPTVDQTPPDPDPSLTTRERFAEHTAIPSCNECHKKIDGIGFGLEGYDHLGRYRDEEFGLPVDVSGEILEATDPHLNGNFNGAVELAARLADSVQVQSCLATQWYRYAMGRIETQADLCSLQQVQTRLAESDGKLQELLVGLTLTDAFRYRVPTTAEVQQ